MGVLIALLAMVLVGELMRRAFFSGSPPPLSAVPPLRAVDPGLPPDARIVDLVATQHHVVIHAVLPDGQALLYVLDPEAETRAEARPQIVEPDRPDQANPPLAR